jgi:hypothetical protein
VSLVERAKNSLMKKQEEFKENQKMNLFWWFLPKFNKWRKWVTWKTWLGWLGAQSHDGDWRWCFQHIEAIIHSMPSERSKPSLLMWKESQNIKGSGTKIEQSIDETVWNEQNDENDGPGGKTLKMMGGMKGMPGGGAMR